jgi:asparagine synthase (glutamine-hydrolysing)
MFAVALWSERDRRLVLARDRMGIKPLYIHQRGEDLYFGSELKSILEHRSVERHLDLEGLNDYLSLNWVPCPHTLVRDIRKLPPASWLDWRDGRVETGTYWQLEKHTRRISLDDAAAELDTLLRDAVREHLISDVPLGIWASGGLDSSTILHYASEGAAGRLKTFSVSFRGERCDESPWFRQVAEVYGTDHHEFDLNPDVELADAIHSMAWHSDEPSADAGALPVWFLSKMSRRHVTVALSGEGADELFGGYVTYLADRYHRYARLAPPLLRRAALKALNAWPVSDHKIGLDYKLKRFLSGSLLDAREAHQFWNGTSSQSERLALLNPSAFVERQPLADRTGLQSFLETDQRYYLADDILYKCDRMSMAHSLEVRPPFLDHRIVEFAASLPEDLKIRGSELKHVLRHLMRTKLPPAVINRRKEGFDIPAHGWFRGPLKTLLLETVTREAVERTGLFRWPAIESMIRAHLDRRQNLGYHLWGILTLLVWMKRWNMQALSSRAQALEEPALTSFSATTN